MEQLLRDLVARSHLSVAHAAALVQIDAAHGATEQARGRLGELVSTGLETLRPDMVYVWALTELARGCKVLGAVRYAPRIYRALAPYAGRAAVAAGAVMCSGSTDFYLAGLAALNGDSTAAHRHYRTAVSCHRRLGAEEWNDTERATRLRAERDFLVRELTAATGLGGRARRLGSESERARINVTRAIRSAISRIRDRAPGVAAHLDETVRTGTRCSYSLPNGPTRTLGEAPRGRSE